MKPDLSLVVPGCEPRRPCESSEPAGLTPAIVEALLEERSQLVWHVVRWVGNRADAEDVMQEAYVRLLRKGGDLRRRKSAAAWFRSVVRTVTIDHIRRREVEKRARLAWSREMEIGSEELPSFGRASCECLREALLHLRPTYAGVLRLVDIEDASIAEVAKELGLTSNGVRVRLHRARADLKRRLLNVCSVCGRRRRLDCDCRERPAAAARAAMNGASVMSEVGDSSSNGGSQ